MAAFLLPRRSAVVRWRGTLEGLLPEQHPARFLWQMLLSLDFSALEERYVSVRTGAGRPPYHPRVLAALWIYGMSQGLETAVSIAKACRLRDDFRWLAGGLCPSDQSLLNFLTGSGTGLTSIWVQVLRAMHQAGHIDLSAIAEDGTKLRANASHRSFLNATDIGVVIETLKVQIATKLKQATDCPGEEQQDEVRVEMRNLQLRLSRAELAAQELEQRTQRRNGQPGEFPGAKAEMNAAGASLPVLEKVVLRPLFTGRDFRPDPDRNVLICPGDQELRFIGEYPTDNSRSRYKLYGRKDCGDCALKPQCTNGRGRRTKIMPEEKVSPRLASPPTTSPHPTHAQTIADTAGGADSDERPGGRRASITEPEAVMMLATSEKRWEPSYNADLAVTRHGIIISQFLTKNPTDFSHFGPALRAVISTVGKPQSWIGDGHYGTQANVVLADHEGVFLYAPPAWDPVSEDPRDPSDPPDGVLAPVEPCDSHAPQPAVEMFTRHHFRLDQVRQVLICPAEHELSLIGEYPTDNGLRSYRLYSRRDCGDCPRKDRCTNAKGRRVKIPIRDKSDLTTMHSTEEAVAKPARNLISLLEALEKRMSDVGDAVLKFRRETIEPVNAHLKQHGLGRFHVHGLARCQAVLTLACIAHNLGKWRAREIARSLKPAA